MGEFNKYLRIIWMELIQIICPGVTYKRLINKELINNKE